MPMAGGGGHIQAMITSLRNNRLMRRHARFGDRQLAVPSAAKRKNTSGHSPLNRPTSRSGYRPKDLLWILVWLITAIILSEYLMD